ncbi:MAG: hypothetical protein IH905_13725 [Proteobacteria bacterium]|nr:hypothetical protein [Pseudomonadota bacterium]
MFFKFGDSEVSLQFSGIRNEFKLEGTPDEEMLEFVRESLKFVQVMQMGDEFPEELKTGRASWEVTKEHKQIAYQRLTMQLVSWLSGDEVVVTNPGELMKIADDPRTKERVKEAFTRAAEALGIDAEESYKVIDLITVLADELSHIEFLREMLAKVKVIGEKLEELRSYYLADRVILEIIEPMTGLMGTAIKELSSPIDQVDAQTGEILAVLKNIAPQVRFVRNMRDNLYRRLKAWDKIFEAWDNVIMSRSDNNEQVLRDTYRFLAPRYMKTDDWVLFSQLQESESMKSAMRW